MILGAITAVLPFVGFPSNWQALIFAAIGILMILIAYNIKPSVDMNKGLSEMPYEENKSDLNSVERSDSGQAMKGEDQIISGDISKNS